MTTARFPRWQVTVLLLCIAIVVLMAALAWRPRVAGLLANSALLAGGMLAIALPLGVLLAVAEAKTNLRGRRWLGPLLLAWMFVPLYVQAAAWQAAAGTGGWLSTPASSGNLASPWLAGWFGAVWVHGVAAVPWVAVIVRTALATVPRELEEAALQDAPAWRVLLAVSLRRSWLGVAAAALWVAAMATAEIAVTDLFQVRTFAEEVYTASSLGLLGGNSAVGKAANGLRAEPLACGDLAVGIAAVAAVVALALAASWTWLSPGAVLSAASPWRWQLRQGRSLVALLVIGVLLVTVAIPVASLIAGAGVEVDSIDGEFHRSWSASKAARLTAGSFWEHRREWGWSLAIGAAATILVVAVGTVVAWSLRTGKLPKLPTAFALACVFAIPSPLVGVWITWLLNQSGDGPVSTLTWLYDHTIVAPVLGQFVRVLPLAVLLLFAALESVADEQLAAAQTAGAGWWRRLLAVAVPQRLRAIAATALLSLVVCLGELSATLLVAPPGVSTLSIRIFGLLHYGSEDRVAAISLGLLAVTVFVALVTTAVASFRSLRR